MSFFASQKESNFPVVFASLSFGFVCIVKIIIFCLLKESRHQLLSLPGIFYIDIVVWLSFLVGFHITQSSRIIRKLFLGFAMASICWQSFLAILSLGYYWETSNFIDWFALADFLRQDWGTIFSYLRAFSYMIFWISFVFLVILVIKITLVRFIVSKAQNYKKLPSQDLEESLNQDTKSRTSTMFKIIIVLTSCLSYFFLIDSHSEMATLSENYIISPPLLFLDRSLRRIFKRKESVSSLKHLSDSFKPSFIPVESRFKAKNIVFIFMESLRSDILNFDATTYHGKYLSSILGKPEYIKNFDNTFSPFLNKIKKSSLFFPEAQTVAAYTIKSLLSSICSVFPLTGMTSEYEMAKKIYAPCLPQILKDYNFSTSYFQPSTLDFDHQDLLMPKLGFDQIKSVKDLPNQKWLNYFGVDDRKMLPSLLEFVKTANSQNKPFFASFLTNAGHHPFSLPKKYKKTQYTKTGSKFQVQNDYLNAVNNVDSFVKELFDSFRENGVLNDTLFVIIGDHGMGLGDHGTTGSGEGAFEESFKVPLLFYMDNHNLSELDFSRPNYTVANIDILPTILDFLDIKGQSNWEGSSLIQPIQPYLESRLLYQVSNPINRHSQVIRQRHRKLVYNFRKETYRFFDLKKDPEELDGVYLPSNILKESDLQWIEMAKEQIFMMTKDIAKKYFFGSK